LLRGYWVKSKIPAVKPAKNMR